jgi:hypothetical protein
MVRARVETLRPKDVNRLFKDSEAALDKFKRPRHPSERTVLQDQPVDKLRPWGVSRPVLNGPGDRGAHQDAKFVRTLEVRLEPA